MSLLDPAAARAGALMDEVALVAAMIAVESAWLEVLGQQPLPSLSDAETSELVRVIARRGEEAGNPVVPLVDELRRRLQGSSDGRADQVHRGLTSQDVLDTALVLCARDAAAAITADVHRVVRRLRALASEHAPSVRCGRTLTQPAVPTTFGAVVATWLDVVIGTTTDLTAAAGALPVQLGGAAGTRAGPLLVASGDPTEALALRLGLPSAPPWHTDRRRITQLGDALARLLDACGLIAADVLVGSRPEVGELSEGVGGGSSTMPHKHNPVLSVLVRAQVLAAPGLLATLHAASAAQVDQRADGGWHAEWPALVRLTRSAATAVSLLADLVEGLQVDADRMRTNAAGAADALLAEARRLGARGARLEDYLGAAPTLSLEAVARADDFLGGGS